MAPFEFDGQKYAQASQHQQEWGEKIIAELPLRGCESILDLGCGDGRLTARLAQRVPQGYVLGIDAARGMIESAQRHAQPNLNFELKNINDIDWTDAFDVIFSNATLQWVKDHRRLLGNAYRALRPGGIVRFNFAGDGNCANLIRVVHQVMRQPEYACHFEGFDWPWYMPGLVAYRQLARGSGFEHVEVWGQNADRYFPDAAAMVRWIDQPSLVPLLQVVPEPHKQRFRDAVVQQMIEQTRQPDGRCFETFRRINLLARKGTVARQDRQQV